MWLVSALGAVDHTYMEVGHSQVGLHPSRIPAALAAAAAAANGGPEARLLGNAVGRFPADANTYDLGAPAEVVSLPSSSSSSQITRKKAGMPLDSPTPSSTDVGDTGGGGTEGSTTTPEGSIMIEEELQTLENLVSKESRHFVSKSEIRSCIDRHDAMPSAYAITLDRSSGCRLGMSILEHVEQTLLVTDVTRGLVQEWNSLNETEPQLQVRPGDRIIVVNGVRGNTRQLLDMCKNNQVLHMSLLRPPAKELAPGVWLVVLDKTGGMKLGIDISQHDGRTLLVTEVREGLVQEWNRENPLHQVMPGDRIIKVNSCQNSAQKLLNECRKNSVLRIAIKKAKAPIDVPRAAQRQGTGGIDLRGHNRSSATVDG